MSSACIRQLQYGAGPTTYHSVIYPSGRQVMHSAVMKTMHSYLVSGVRTCIHKTVQSYLETNLDSVKAVYPGQRSYVIIAMAI